MTTKINPKDYKFGIIRYHNSPMKAQLPNGKIVYRADKIFVPEYGGFVPCAQYDNHFIYEVPQDFIGAPSFACTCGYFACVVGLSGYILDASPQGKMIVCHYHASHGVHATGESRWI